MKTSTWFSGHYLKDSSTFTEPAEDKDYGAFKNHFLETSDDYVKTYVVQGINAVCESLVQSTFAKGRIEAQVIGSQTAADIVRIQSDNGWISISSNYLY